MNEPDPRPVKWVVDPDHPSGHAVPMTDEEVAQSERDRTEDRERDEIEQERLTAELHRFVEQPDWAEQLAAMPTDAEREAAVRRSFIEFLNAQGIDLWQHAYSLRAVAADVRLRGDDGADAIAGFLEAQAEDLERGAG